MSAPLVTVGLRKGRFFVFPTYSPGRGTYILKGPVRETSPSNVGAIGRHIREALDEFVEGGQMPDPNFVDESLLAAVGTSTWTEYDRGLKDGIISRFDTFYRLKGDHGPLEVPQSADCEELGRAILQVMGAPKRYWHRNA